MSQSAVTVEAEGSLVAEASTGLPESGETSWFSEDDSADPEYGSGSNIGGLGLVFVITVVIIVVGLVLMIAQRVASPAFFRGETLEREAPVSARRRHTS